MELGVFQKNQNHMAGSLVPRPFWPGAENLCAAQDCGGRTLMSLGVAETTYIQIPV